MWHSFLLQHEVFFEFYLRQRRNYFGINFLIWATSWQGTCLSCQWRELTYKLPLSPTLSPPFFLLLPLHLPWPVEFFDSFGFISFGLVWFHFGLVILTNENNIWYAKHMWRNHTYAPHSHQWAWLGTLTTRRMSNLINLTTMCAATTQNQIECNCQSCWARVVTVLQQLPLRLLSKLLLLLLLQLQLLLRIFNLFSLLPLKTVATRLVNKIRRKMPKRESRAGGLRKCHFVATGLLTRTLCMCHDAWQAC